MSIKSKKERREKFTNIIGEYSVEILSECIRILKKSHNYTFIDSNGKSCFKPSTISIARKNKSNFLK
jgi:hypothetical protein